MKRVFKFYIAGIVALMMFVNSPLLASPNKTEAELIQMLYSGDYHKINDAFDRLPRWYPDSTNAVRIAKEMLHSNEVMIVTRTASQSKRNGFIDSYVLVTTNSSPHDIVTRMAARALGNYHATLNEEDLNIVCNFLKSSDVEEVMDGLKSLRGLNVPQVVPQIIPLLKDSNEHILRDACRTLAVLANKDAIPFIEPLLKNPRFDVKEDAAAAIKTLQAKS